MKLTKCMYQDCNNLTIDSFTEYGAYCFRHSNLTHSPQKVERIKGKILRASPLAERKIFFGNMDVAEPLIMEVSRNERVSKSPSKSMPTPSSRIMNDIRITPDKMKCCICDTNYFMSQKMNCGHLLCPDCLESMRSVKCPMCNKDMKGPMMHEYIYNELRERQTEDEGQIYDSELIY